MKFIPPPAPKANTPWPLKALHYFIVSLPVLFFLGGLAGAFDDGPRWPMHVVEATWLGLVCILMSADQEKYPVGKNTRSLIDALTVTGILVSGLLAPWGLTWLRIFGAVIVVFMDILYRHYVPQGPDPWGWKPAPEPTPAP